MGSGASSIPQDLKPSILKALQDEKDLLQTKGSSEDEIRERLLAMYATLMEADGATVEATAESNIATTKASSEEPVSSDGRTKAAVGLPKGKLRKSASTVRRRSFENNVTQAPLAAQDEVSKAIKAAVGSSSTPAIVPVEAVVDSWDSVTEQPFCTICQMAFKTPAFLDRHNKYSDLHMRAVAKLESASKALPEVNAATTGVPTDANTSLDSLLAQKNATQNNGATMNVEGQHYKLIYSGSKLYWRTQENIDITCYLHILAGVIEIIPYDDAKAKEFPRIYLDNYMLTTLTKTEIDDRLSNDRLKETEGGKYSLAVSTPTQTEDMERLVITTYLLGRLQKVDNNIVFVRTACDNPEFNPVLKTLPAVVIPIPVTRRRRSSAEEITSAMNDMATDRAALSAALVKAEVIANVVHQSAAGFTMKKWWASLNPVRRRWIRAIRLVIRMKHVRETTAALRKLLAANPGKYPWGAAFLMNNGAVPSNSASTAAAAALPKKGVTVKSKEI